MKFGLILSTLGRTKEVESLLESLSNQIYKNFYLIIIDQNKSNELITIVDKFKVKFTIKHFKVNFKGLSRARNYGLKHLESNTDIVAFPDDDCEYPEDVLLNVVSFFKRNPKYDFVTGVSIDKDGNISNGKFKVKPVKINKLNLLKTAISYTLFVRNYCLTNISFDENLGVGAKFGSAEETDFIYQLLEKRCKGFYLPDLIKVVHPNKNESCNDHYIERASYYALGLGAFFKKNFLKNKDINLIIPFFEYMVFKPLIGIFLNLIRWNKCRVKLYLYILKNRWKGFFTYV